MIAVAVTAMAMWLATEGIRLGRRAILFHGQSITCSEGETNCKMNMNLERREIAKFEKLAEAARVGRILDPKAPDGPYVIDSEAISEIMGEFESYSYDGLAEAYDREAAMHKEEFARLAKYAAYFAESRQILASAAWRPWKEAPAPPPDPFPIDIIEYQEDPRITTASPGPER
jgi:hypothetical protein